jgi:hypothetical protein
MTEILRTDDQKMPAQTIQREADDGLAEVL